MAGNEETLSSSDFCREVTLVIFTTVGTGSRGFDALVIEMDHISTKIKEKVIIQVGNGSYTPQHADYFKFATPLQPYFDQARIVVSAGGVGTIFDLLNQSKPVIAVCNNEIPDGHQQMLLERLSNEGYLIWCREQNRLIDLLVSDNLSFKVYEKPECRIEEIIYEKLWNQQS